MWESTIHTQCVSFRAKIFTTKSGEAIQHSASSDHQWLCYQQYTYKAAVQLQVEASDFLFCKATWHVSVSILFNVPGVRLSGAEQPGYENDTYRHLIKNKKTYTSSAVWLHNEHTLQLPPSSSC
jgi:hypothetical protein